MDIIKIEITKDNTSQTKKLAELMVQRHKEQFPRLPPPTVRYFSKMIKAAVRPSFRKEYYLLNLDNEPIGFVELLINKLINLNYVAIDFYLAEQYQDDDYLKQALMELIDNLHEDITMLEMRRVIDAQTGEVTKQYLDCYDKIIDHKVYTERINVSQFGEFDIELVTETANKLHQDAIGKGYVFEFVKNGRFKDHPRIEYTQFLDAVETIWNDMPREDGDWDDEIVTEEIYTDIFSQIASRGGKAWSLVALEEKNNAIAGYTDISFYKTRPHIVLQGDTGVLTSHRGNRLGKTLKYMMLQQILVELADIEPWYWITGNANSNQYMLAINNELGYKHWYSEIYYDVPREIFPDLLQ